MGIGPWAQGDLIRETRVLERTKFRRAIDREVRGLNTCYGGKATIPTHEVRMAFERLRVRTLTPKKAIPKPKTVPARRPK